MPTYIKPGQMGSASDISTPSEFANSMAAEIERQLFDLLQAEGMPAPTLDSNSKATRERRVLFVAIARGIVKHLDMQRAAISVTLPADAGSVSPEFNVSGKDW